MKKFYLLMALCLSFAITSCGDKNEDETLIVDYAPVEFYISVENEAGVDLLNSENEGALDVDAITLEYKGEVHSFNSEASAAFTRAYLPRFKGMELQKIDSKYRMYVGEFEGGYNIELDSFVIDWGDGSVGTFSYSNQIIKPMEVERNFYYNGKKQSSSHITIVKK